MRRRRMTVGRCPPLSACLAVALGLLAAPAVAADGSWNLQNSGNWNATGSWLGGVIPGSTTLTDSTDVATFGFTLTALRTGTVDANRNIGGIIFSNTSAFGYTLTGGNLLLSNGGLIQTAAGNGNHTDTISSAIAIQGVGGSGTFAANATSASSLLSITGSITGVSTTGSTTTLALAGDNAGANTISGVIGNGTAGGSLAITKTGTGLWVLSAANTFSGGVTLSDGRLAIANNSALGTGTLTFNGGGLSSSSTTAYSLSNNILFTGNGSLGHATNSGILTLSGAVDLGNATRTLTVLSTATMSGVISNGGLTKDGAGQLILANANTYTGPTTVSSGTLTVGNGSTAGRIASGTISVASGGVFNFNRSDDYGGGYAATFTGLGAVRQTTGTLSLSGSNDFSGGFTLAAGRLNINGATALGTGTFTIAGGSIDNTSGAALAMTANNPQAWNGDFTFAGSNALNLGTGAVTMGAARIVTVTSSTLTVGGAISSGGFGLTSSGSGTLRLAGNNTFGNVTITRSGTGTLELSGSNTFAGTVTIGNSGRLVVGHANALGSGTVTGVNPNSFSVSASAPAYLADATMTVPNYQTITVDGTNSFGFGKVVMGVNHSLANNLPASETFTIGALQTGIGINNSNLQGTGNFSIGRVVPLISNTTATNAQNQFNVLSTGTTTITELLAQSDGNNQGGLYLYGGARVVIGPNAVMRTPGRTTSDGYITGSTAVASTFEYASNLDSTVTGVISGSGVTVAKTGLGTLTLSGSNTFRNGIILAAGQLNVANNVALGAGVSTFTITGGTLANATASGITLANNQPVALNGNFAFAGPSDLNLGTGAVTLGASPTVTVSAATLTLGGAIGGAGFGLTKQGNGALVLSNANTFSGGVTLSSGTLMVGNNSALGSGTLTINAGNLQSVTAVRTLANNVSVAGDFSLGGSTATNDVALSGTVDLGSVQRTITLANLVSTGSLTGRVVGSGGFVKAGAGTLVLSGSNTYTGPTTLNAGVLLVSNTFGLSGSSLVVNGGEARLNGVNISLATPITVAGGTIGSGFAPGSLTNTGSALDARSGLVSAILSGTAGFAKTTSGTFALSGLNTFTGNTQLDAGVLSLQSAAALGAGGTVSFGGGTLQFTRYGTTDYSARFSSAAGQLYNLDVAAAATVALATGFGSTGGVLTKTGPGTLVLSGSNGFTGGININGGILTVAGVSQLGPSGTVSFAGGALGLASGTVGFGDRFSQAAGQPYAFDTAAGVSATIPQGLSSAGGSLTKSGAGTLVLAGTNGYTGPTTITGGILQFATRSALYGGSTASWTKDNITVGAADTLAVDVGGTGEFTAGDVSTLLANLGGTGGLVNGNGLLAGSSIGFDTANAAGGTFTVADAIADSTGSGGGAVGVMKLGSGVLVLSGSSSFTGGVTVNAGTLRAGSAAAFGAGGSRPVVLNGGTLDLNGYSQSVGPLTGNAGGVITTSSAAGTTTLTTLVSSGTSLFSGSIQDNAPGLMSLAKTGAGVLAIAGANTFTGTTSINAGTLELRQAGGLAGPIAIGSGATFGIRGDTGGSLSVAGAISGSGGIVKSNYGSVTLSSASSTFSGGVTVNRGQVVATSPAALGSGTVAITRDESTSLRDGGGALSLVSGTGIVLANAMTIAGGYAMPNNYLQWYQANFTAYFAGGALQNTGNNRIGGDVTLTDSNGGIASNFGTLTLAGSVSSTSSSVSAQLGGLVRVDGRLSASGTVRVNAGGLMLSSTANSIRAIHTGAGGIVQASNGFSGGNVVLGGDMGSLGLIAVRASAASAATNFANDTFVSLSQAGSGRTNQFSVDALGTETSGTVQFKSVNLTHLNAADKAVFYGGNGYNLTFGSGTNPALNFISHTLATEGIESTVNGWLTFNGNVNVDQATDGAIIFNNAGDIRITGELRDASPAGTTNLSKRGNGLLVLESTTSSFTGVTTAAAGGIQVTAMAALPQGQLNLAGGSLRYNGAGETSTKTVNLSGAANSHGWLWANQSGTAATPLVLAGSITATGTGAKTLYLGGSSTLDNEIRSAIPNAAGSTAVSLWKNGVGTWVLSGTNTFTGSTTVSGGVLKIQAGAAAASMLPNTGGITFAADPYTNGAAGTFSYLGASGTANSEVVGALTPSAGAGRIQASGSGSGSAILTFASLGTRTAGATVDFSPTNSGTIQFQTAPSTPNGIFGPAYSLSGGGWATVSGTTVSSLASYTNIAATGDVIASGSTTNVRLNSAGGGGNITLGSGTTLVNTLLQNTTTAATVALNANALRADGVMIGTGMEALAIGATPGDGTLTTSSTGGSELLLWNHSANALTINAVIANNSGTAALTKSGTGTLVLTASNTYTGNTTINEGTVRLSGASATLGVLTTAANRTTIRQGGTLDINAAGANATIRVGMVDGSGLVTNSGGSSGTAASTLQFGESTTTTGTGVFTGLLQDGTGKLGVTKAGAAASRQFLTAANTYTGPTTLTSGTLSVTSLANIGQASGIGRGDATSDDTNAASLVFNGGALQYTGIGMGDTMWTQTPTVTLDRLFTLAGDGTIDSSGNFAFAGANSATLILGNSGSVRFSGAGTRTLTLRGNSAGNNRIDMRLVDNGADRLAVTKADGGVWWLNNTSNSYSGTTSVSGGALIVGDDSSAVTRTLSQNSNLNLSGGLLQSSGTFTRAPGTGANQVQLTANATGFAAGEADLLVNLGNGATLSWGQNGFMTTGGTMALNSGISRAVVTFANPINIGNGVTRTMTVNDNGLSAFDYAVMSGEISGTGTLVKAGAPNLRLSGQNTLSGTIRVDGGALVVDSFGGTGVNASSLGGPETRLLLNGNTVNYIGGGESSDRRTEFTGGTILNNGSGPLTLTNVSGTAAGTLSLGGSYLGANTISGSWTGARTISILPGANWILSGSNGLPAGSIISIDRGAIGVGSDQALGEASFSFGNFSGNTIGALPSVFAAGGDRRITNSFNIENSESSASPSPSVTFFGDYSLTVAGTMSMLHKISQPSFTLMNLIAAGKKLTFAGPFTSGTADSKTYPLAGTGDTVISGTMSTTAATNSTLNHTSTGTLVISGSGNASSRWNVTATSGVVLFTNTAAYWSSATLTSGSAGAIAAGFAIDNAFLNRVAQSSAGVVALAADSANKLDFSSSGRNLTAASLGAVGSGTYAYSGVLTPNGTAYRLGGGGGTLDFQGVLSGSGNTLTIGGNAAGLGGTVILSNTANSFTGKTTVPFGTLGIASLGNVNGGNSALGNPADATAGTIDLGSGTSSATLRYVGSGSSSSNRTINLVGSSGGATIEAAGSGPLVLTGTIAAAADSKTLALGGTSTAANSIGLIKEQTTTGSLSVVKEGSGLWRLTAANDFAGSFTLKNGTVVVENSGAFGDTGLPIVGDTADGATGTVALLAEAGVSSTIYGVTVTAAGAGSTQTVLLGGASSNGTAIYAGNVSLNLGRNVSLVATTGGTTNFGSNWRNGSGTGIPTVDVAIGAPGYAGTVKLAPPSASGTLATTGAVSVRYGTAVLGESMILDGAGTLSIDAGATLGGVGTVAGPLGGAGLVAPGNSPGILTAEAFDASGGLGAAFEFSGTAAPNYASTSNSLNDVLRLTGTAPFLTSTLGAGNVVNIYLPSTVAGGDVFLGGFFADNGGSFTSLIQNATYNYWVAGSGTHVYNSGTYVPLATIDPAWSVDVATTSQTSGTFANGDQVNGTVSTFTVVVPEPAAVALAAIGVAMAGYAVRRRRPL